MKDNRTFSEKFKVWFGLAAVELGIVCGGAMASGSYAVSYFASTGGGHMLVFLLIWGLFFIVAGGLAMNFSRAFKLYDYNTYYMELWGANSEKAHPVHKAVVTIFFDLYSLMTMIVGEASCIALGGTVCNVVFGWPMMVGNVIFGILFVVFMIKGSGLLRKASGFMTVVLLVSIVAVLFAVTGQKGDVLAQYLGNFEIGADWLGQTLGQRYWAIISYAATTFNGAVMLVNCAQNIKTKQDSWMTAVLAAVMCMLCFGATATIVLPYLPAEITNSAPILTICAQYLGSKVFFYVYWVIMFFALISSGPPITFNMANRCLKIWKSDKVKEDVKLAILGVAVQVIAIAVSSLGLMTLVAKGLALSGQVTLFAVAVPTVLTIPYRVAKKDKADAAAAAAAAE